MGWWCLFSFLPLLLSPTAGLECFPESFMDQVAGDDQSHPLELTTAYAGISASASNSSGLPEGCHTQVPRPSRSLTLSL